MAQFVQGNKPIGGCRGCQSNVTLKVPKWESQTLELLPTAHQVL